MANLCELLLYRQHSPCDALQRRIASHIHSHASFVEKLKFSCELQGHRGCVNCLEWNTNGSLLASGSDDTSAILWDPYRRKAVATMQTGHTGNIFSVKFLPFSGDQMLVTSSEDGEVRLHDLSTFDTTQVWCCSQGRVKRVATSPHAPYLCWAASEDGCVRRLDAREPHTCHGGGASNGGGGGGCRNVIIDLKLSSRSSLNHPIQCKCIDINPVRTEQIAVGASDEFARIYDARLCTARTPMPSAGGGKFPAHSSLPSLSQDPSCIGFFSPGHLSCPSSASGRGRKGGALGGAFCSSVASTYISFSQNGRELLVNLSSEQIYLYDTTNPQNPISYDFDRNCGKVDSSTPLARPVLRTYTQDLSSVRGSSGGSGIESKLRPFLLEPHSIPASEPVVNEMELNGELVQLKNAAKELFKQDKLEEALRLLNEAITKCPNWHTLYFLRGTTLYSRKWSGDMYAALRDIETSLSLCPSHKLSQQRRVQCLMDLGMLEEARGFLQRYQMDHPSDAKFLARIGKELEKTSKDSEAGSSSNGYHHHSNGTSSRPKPHPPPSSPSQSPRGSGQRHLISDYKTRYCGHCNTHTDIKEAVFIGDGCGYIAAGSDDGNIFIWEKLSGNLVRVLRGDTSIVNCIQWHPATSLMATSGIENVVRLWEPGSSSSSGTGMGPGQNEELGSDVDGGSSDSNDERVVSDLSRVCKENQQRMGMDPFEVRLMRMGFILTMAEEAAQNPAHRGGGAPHRRGAEGQGEPMEQGDLSWIENPANCRQQ